MPKVIESSSGTKRLFAISRQQLRNPRKSAINRCDLVAAIRSQSGAGGGQVGAVSKSASGVAPKMPLTDTAIRAAKPSEKPVKLSDDRGLFLLIQPSGGKLWRLNYRIAGKEKKLSIGRYPDVGLITVGRIGRSGSRWRSGGRTILIHYAAHHGQFSNETSNILTMTHSVWIPPTDAA